MKPVKITNDYIKFVVKENVISTIQKSISSSNIKKPKFCSYKNCQSIFTFFNNLALIATITVLSDIKTAPTAGSTRMPCL